MRWLLALVALVATLAVCNALVAALGLAPAVIELPTQLTVGLGTHGGHEELATFVYDPDPAIRWTATDSPRTLLGPGDASLHLGIIGDSEAYGYCAGRENALDVWLTGYDLDVRVTNFAVSGYDAGQNAARALRDVPRANPPVTTLVWLWHWNDRAPATYNALMRLRDERAVYVATEGWLVRNVPLYRLAWATLANAYTPPIPPTAELLRRVSEGLHIPILLIPLRDQAGQMRDDPSADAYTVPGVRIVELGEWARDPRAWCDDAHMSTWGKQRQARAVLAALGRGSNAR